MPQSSEIIKKQWKDRIFNQSQSGLSIAAWCRQNHIAPYTFYYWRDKFFPKSLDRTDFKEIREQYSDDIPTKDHNSGVSLQYHEFCIYLDRDFDLPALKECLKILEEISC